MFEGKLTRKIQNVLIEKKPCKVNDIFEEEADKMNVKGSDSELSTRLMFMNAKLNSKGGLNI